jgi:Uncharacterized protein conserved in bacteria
VAEREYALGVINNWRSSHSYPLQVVKMALLHRAKRIDPKAIVAQRLKRLSSIAVKLRFNRNMKLSQMQDIGGCRAVLERVSQVADLIKLYEEAIAKNPHDRPECVERYDYIAHPKADGYRGVHYVYKYRSGSPHKVDLNGLRIEVQLRSRLQHAWATAVETVSTFTGQALKSNVGDEAWKRFFALMGSAIAHREKRVPVPNTPINRQELADELRAYTKRLKVEEVLQGWGYALSLAARNEENAEAYLLVLDPEAMKVDVTGYNRNELGLATEDYLATEKSIQGTPGAQAVLVSVESLDALRSAYPNYYLDTTAFVRALRLAIAE